MTDMFSPGATLRAARERRRLSAADVAEATRIKRHIIEGIENNDFSGIAAPLYGRGFIKLYADLVGLDPAPLIHDYMERYARAVRPSLKSEQSASPAPSGPSGGQALPPPSTLERFKSSGGTIWQRVADDLSLVVSEASEQLAGAWMRLRLSLGGGAVLSRRRGRGYAGTTGRWRWQTIAAGAAGVILAILLALGLAKLLSRSDAGASPATRGEGAARPLRLVEEPPPSYVRATAP